MRASPAIRLSPPRPPSTSLPRTSRANRNRHRRIARPFLRISTSSFSVAWRRIPPTAGRQPTMLWRAWMQSPARIAGTQRGSPLPQHVEIVDRLYQLTETVCRGLDRATLDPRIIGTELLYADNQLESDVLLVLLHGTGQDAGVFRDLMETLPYRCVAPTLLGFEARKRSSVVLSLAAHLEILRAFVRDVIEMTRARTTIVVGFSSGADVALLLAGSPDADLPHIDGIVSL